VHHQARHLLLVQVEVQVQVLVGRQVSHQAVPSQHRQARRCQVARRLVLQCLRVQARLRHLLVHLVGHRVVALAAAQVHHQAHQNRAVRVAPNQVVLREAQVVVLAAVQVKHQVRHHLLHQAVQSRVAQARHQAVHHRRHRLPVQVAPRVHRQVRAQVGHQVHHQVAVLVHLLELLIVIRDRYLKFHTGHGCLRFHQKHGCSNPCQDK